MKNYSNTNLQDLQPASSLLANPYIVAAKLTDAAVHFEPIVKVLRSKVEQVQPITNSVLLCELNERTSKLVRLAEQAVISAQENNALCCGQEASLLVSIRVSAFVLRLYGDLLRNRKRRSFVKEVQCVLGHYEGLEAVSELYQARQSWRKWHTCLIRELKDLRSKPAALVVRTKSTCGGA